MTLNFYRTTNKGTDLNNFFRCNQCPLDHCVLDVGLIDKVRLSGEAQHCCSVCASHPAAPGSICGAPKNLTLDVAEIY